MSRRFPEQRNIFRTIARDESDHAERFYLILGRLNQLTYSTKETRFQADHNIQILEKTGILGNLRKGDKRVEKVLDLKLAIVEAVELEKDTLLFYQNLEKKLENIDEKVIQEIIEKEYEHLQKLKNLDINTF